MQSRANLRVRNQHRVSADTTHQRVSADRYDDEVVKNALKEVLAELNIHIGGTDGIPVAVRRVLEEDGLKSLWDAFSSWWRSIPKMATLTWSSWFPTVCTILLVLKGADGGGYKAAVITACLAVGVGFTVLVAIWSGAMNIYCDFANAELGKLGIKKKTFITEKELKELVSSYENSFLTFHSQSNRVVLQRFRESKLNISGVVVQTPETLFIGTVGSLAFIDFRRGSVWDDNLDLVSAFKDSRNRLLLDIAAGGDEDVHLSVPLFWWNASVSLKMSKFEPANDLHVVQETTANTLRIILQGHPAGCWKLAAYGRRANEVREVPDFISSTCVSLLAMATANLVQPVWLRIRMLKPPPKFPQIGALGHVQSGVDNNSKLQLNPGNNYAHVIYHRQQEIGWRRAWGMGGEDSNRENAVHPDSKGVANVGHHSQVNQHGEAQACDEGDAGYVCPVMRRMAKRSWQVLKGYLQREYGLSLLRFYEDSTKKHRYRRMYVSKVPTNVVNMVKSDMYDDRAHIERCCECYLNYLKDEMGIISEKLTSGVLEESILWVEVLERGSESTDGPVAEQKVWICLVALLIYLAKREAVPDGQLGLVGASHNIDSISGALASIDMGGQYQPTKFEKSWALSIADGIIDWEKHVASMAPHSRAHTQPNEDLWPSNQESVSTLSSELEFDLRNDFLSLQ